MFHVAIKILEAQPNQVEETKLKSWMVRPGGQVRQSESLSKTLDVSKSVHFIGIAKCQMCTPHTRSILPKIAKLDSEANIQITISISS